MRALILIALTACTAEHDQLARAQSAFDASAFARAEVSLRDLETSRAHLRADGFARPQDAISFGQGWRCE